MLGYGVRFDGTSALDVAGGNLVMSWSTEGIAVPSGLVDSTVREILAPHPRQPELPLVDQILDIIVGSPQNRFDPRLDDEGIRLLRQRIEQLVATNAPVSFSTMWGAIKHYVTDDDQGVDLAELFAVLRIVQLVTDISAVYEPGAYVNVIIEDFGVWYEDAYGRSADVQRSVIDGSRRYVTGLLDLVHALGGKSIRPHLFFDSVDLDYRDSIARVEYNRGLLEAYWNAGPDDAAAFEVLCAAGWSGHIHDETRRHYLKRLKKLYPHEDETQGVHRITQYLAMVLLYEQVDMLRGIDPDAIRLAFYQQAPRLARERALGRVHARGLPRARCSTVMPPWTSRGCWVLEADGRLRPRIESFLELTRAGTTFHEGHLRVQHDGRQADVRMDVVLRNGQEARILPLKHYGASPL